MPAQAAALSMNQFKVFNGCTHCLLTGTRVGPRWLYLCDAEIWLRVTDNFRRHEQKADKRSEFVAGIKGTSPLSSNFSFPGDALIDPMHQVGTGKVLTKLFISDLNGKDGLKFNEMLKTCMLLVDYFRGPKHVDELRYWKAADFKLLFFHLIRLGMDSFPRICNDRKESFSRLSSPFDCFQKWWLRKLILQRQMK